MGGGGCKRRSLKDKQLYSSGTGVKKGWGVHQSIRGCLRGKYTEREGYLSVVGGKRVLNGWWA